MTGVLRPVHTNECARQRIGKLLTAQTVFRAGQLAAGHGGQIQL